MRNPIEVLSSLRAHAKDKSYKFQRLYRNFYNENFFLLAYSNIYSKPGNMTPGVDEKTIDEMSLERIRRIISGIKDHSYQPKPARREYIKKSNGKKRPLGIPSFDDKLVQEVLRMILESIYEETFSKYSHGFRPGKSCHTALLQLQTTFSGAKWFIEGDIKSFFDNINHQKMVEILRERIQDEYFIALIWKFLKAGYLEDWTFHKTYSGTPQGSIISPILSNIYLNEFDQYMELHMKSFYVGKARERAKDYRHLEAKLRYAQKKYAPEKWATFSQEQKNEALSEIKAIQQEMRSTNAKVPMDTGYKRLQYVRYADDWICAVIGSKEDAMKIKEAIQAFLSSCLKLELSEEKTLITHSKDKARFLGYDIFIGNTEKIITDSRGQKRRTTSGKIVLSVPKEKWLNKLLDYSALQIKYVDGKEIFIPRERTYLIHNDDLEIVSQYNAEIRGLYNYYRIAHNATVLNCFYYVMKYSMFKTYASKYKTTIAKIRKKFGRKRFGITYTTKTGQKTAYLYDEGFKRDKNGNISSDVDVLKTMYNWSRTSLIQKVKADRCEWCGVTGVLVVIHHVRKLKDLKGKKRWEQVMIARKRKTMGLCQQCHNDLHAGKLD